MSSNARSSAAPFRNQTDRPRTLTKPGERYLCHRHDGIDLRLDYARDVLVTLHKIWSRRVNLETVVEWPPRPRTFDGQEQKDRELEGSLRLQFCARPPNRSAIPRCQRSRSSARTATQSLTAAAHAQKPPLDLQSRFPRGLQVLAFNSRRC